MTREEKAGLWVEWRASINMSERELRAFLRQWGDVAGLSRREARAQGIRSGRDSARALVGKEPRGGMIARGRTFRMAFEEWKPSEWTWARRQVSFIARMRGARGKLRIEGIPSRRLLALKLWGHDPEKKRRRR